MDRKLLYIFTCIGLISSLHVYAQSNTRGVNTADTSLGRLGTLKNTPTHKILLIPFYSKMCMVEIGKDVNLATKLDFNEIVEQFRIQLDLAVYNAFRRDYSVISLLQGRYRSDSVVNYIYGSTGYKYDMVPGATADIGAQDKNKSGNYIQNGQLKVPIDYSKRFMNVNISNPHLIGTLYKDYHTDTFVFINELDIKNVNNVAENLSDDTYRREVDVHYSIMDKEKRSIAKGLATTYFPFRVNDPKKIGEKYFAQIADSILRDYIQGLTHINDQQKKQAMQANNSSSPK